MFKFKKLAAFVAATAMAASMAMNVSAVSTDKTTYTPYGTLSGILTIGPAPLGNTKQVTADSILLGGGNAPTISAGLTIREQYTNALLFSDNRSNYNASYAVCMAQPTNAQAEEQKIVVTSSHAVSNGLGTDWSFTLTLAG